MKFTGYVLLLFLFILLLSSSYVILIQELPNKSNTWFSSSGACLLCHSTSNFANRDKQGNDVSPVTRWRSTMLANSSKDPFWKAKVKHEGIENPHHKDALENVCTRCHAPMGMLNALLTSATGYNLDSLKQDDIGKDGISCTLCHQISDSSSPLFSGNFKINAFKEIYGPFPNPNAQQMVANTGFTPVYNQKINDSRLCGACHTLLTNSVDEHGTFTGEVFVEQALYHEWENSRFGKEKISCQSCHMPRIQESVVISSRPNNIPGRNPFGIHNLTGGNLFMLNLLRENHDVLQLQSGIDLLAQSGGRTQEFLTRETMDLKIREIPGNSDSVFVEVTLKNKAGHKFPTGFPSRRAFLECLATNNTDTLFHSGKPGSVALLNSNSEAFEPHHEKITDEKQVQIYEFVMGDTKGNVTTVLEKAYAPLKDNRIVPEGFRFSHTNYDTVRVVGKASNDPDYSSGTGTEKIVYAFPAPKIGSLVQVKVTLHYETAPERWLHEMFGNAEGAEEISKFRTMYYNTSRYPVPVVRDSLKFVYTSGQDFKKQNIRLYPNPTSGKIHIEGLTGPTDYTVYTANGVCVKQGYWDGNSMEVDLHLPTGFYIFVIYTSGKPLSTSLIIQ